MANKDMEEFLKWALKRQETKGAEDDAIHVKKFTEQFSEEDRRAVEDEVMALIGGRKK